MPASTVVQDIGQGRTIIADQVQPHLQIAYDPALGTWHTVKSDQGRISTTNYVWDTGSLAWVKMTQPIGGGGGGAVTVADGANVVEGTTTDAAVTTDVVGTLSAKLRGLVKILGSVWDSANGRLKVDGSAVTQPVSGSLGRTWALTAGVDTVGIAGTVPVSGPLTDAQLRANPVSVTGTFYQATQPVSFTWAGLTDAQLRASAVAVSGTFWQAIQPVSGTVGVNNFPATQVVSGTVTVSGTTATADSAVNLTIADTMQAVLLELRVISNLISQLGQPVQDSSDYLRNDITLLN